MQDAGIAALRNCEDEVEDLRSRIEAGYRETRVRLGEFGRVTFMQPDGAFYAFFKVDGLDDSVEAAEAILNETKVGLAPGSAFGRIGEGYLRLCYAQPVSVLKNAFDRLAPFLDG